MNKPNYKLYYVKATCPHCREDVILRVYAKVPPLNAVVVCETEEEE